MARIFLAIFFAFALLAPAHAANKLALVIGNDAYQELPVLQKAVNDARAVAVAMRGNGFDVDIGENLTRRQFNSKFATLLDRLKPGDTAFFFFAGHGVALNGQNLLLATDVPGAESAELVRGEAFVVDDLLEAVKSKGALVSFFVLDACRNNPFAIKTGRNIGTSRGLNSISPPAGSFVLMSAGAGQEALDRLSNTDPDPNSVFTRNLLPLLSKPGLSHVAIAKELQTSVEASAKTVGHSQRPSYYDEISGMFVLQPAELAMAPTPVQPALPAPAPVQPAAPARPAPVQPVQPAPAQPALAPAGSCQDASAHWAAIGTDPERSLLEEHVERFPTCTFANLARRELDKLQVADKCSADAGRLWQIDGAKKAIETCKRAVDFYPNSAKLLNSLGSAYNSSRQYESAAPVFQRAVDAGSTDAAAALGFMYHNSRGVKHDVTKARELYEIGASGGNVNALNNLGWIYQRGQNVTKDLPRAVQYYERAAALGSASAQINLGIMYREGQGVAKDPKKGLEYLKQAEARGSQDVAIEIGKHYEAGLGVPKNQAQADVYFDKAAKNIVTRLRSGDLQNDRLKTARDFWTPGALRALQRRLKEEGFYSGTIDGRMGAGTRAAIDRAYKSKPGR